MSPQVWTCSLSKQYIGRNRIGSERHHPLKPNRRLTYGRSVH